MKRTYRWNPRTKRLDEVTGQGEPRRPARFSGAIAHTGERLTTREEFTNYVRSNRNLLHPSEIGQMQQEVARNQEHRKRQERPRRRAALVDAIKGRGL